MKDKPIRVEPVRGKHKTEARIFLREIRESFCMQPGCKFRGERAQQGVCFSDDTFVGGRDWSYIEKAEKYVAQTLKETKQLYKGKDYLRHLEGQYFASWMNDIFRLDELVNLRRKAAVLEKKLQTLKAKKPR